MAVDNAVTQSYIDQRIQDREAWYQDIRVYRDYADGEHTDFLTNDQRKQLVGEDDSGNPNTAPEVVLNVCNTVIDAEADRLEVRGFSITVEDNPTLSDELSQLAWSRWKSSRMDEGQQNVHYCTPRDGNSYMVTYLDMDAGESRFAFNRQYDGDNAGIDMLYEDGNPNKPIAAVKIWTVMRPDISDRDGQIQRKNIYYPDRVEKWIRKGGETGAAFAGAQWRALQEGDPDYDETLYQTDAIYPYAGGGSATVAWWTDTGTPDGDPLGIPVAHFRRQPRGEVYGRSVLKDIAPGLQDDINLKHITLLAATILSGFKITYATKFNPSQDTLYVQPAAIISSQGDGTFGQLQETNLIQLRDIVDSAIKNAATLTQTPLSFFNVSGQVAAEGTQKQMEIGLLAKTRRNQTSFGNAYEDAVRMMLKIESVLGNVQLTLEQIDALEIACDWEPAEIRNDLEEAQIAQIWEVLGVPREAIWQKLGFSQDEIAEFQTNEATRRNQVIGGLTASILQAEQQQAQLAEMAQQGPPSGVAQPESRSNGTAQPIAN